MNIIMASSNTAITYELLKHLYSLYINVNKKYIADKQIVLDNILGLAHTCLLAMSKSSTIKMDFQQNAT